MLKNTNKTLLGVLVLLFVFIFSEITNALTIQHNQQVTVSATVLSLPSIDQPGGGGTKVIYQSGVRFSGLSYPNSTVTVLKRDSTFVTSVADNKGYFTIFVPETEWHLFTLYATDIAGRKSTLLNFPTVLYSGLITDISGIRFAPTITTDKLSVKQGDFISIEGSSLPSSTVEIFFDGVENKKFILQSNSFGVYKITIPVSFSKGDYNLRARYEDDSRTSRVINISVGEASILRSEANTNIPGDCNFDQRVTLVDFSILAFWYNKKNPPLCVDTNRDGIINLTDFSILAFYWNG